MIAEALLLLASLSFLVASIGLFRLPNPLARLHAGTKASSFAILIMVTASIIRFSAPGPIVLLLLTLILVFLTAPLACQAIALRLIKGKK